MSTPSSSSSFTFGVLSRSSLDQMIASVLNPSSAERPVVPLPPPSSDVKESDIASVSSDVRQQCLATTLENTRCKNLAKPSLAYCYTHRGQSSTKNSECPICLEPFSDSSNVFLLACAHQLHTECLARLRTDSCPVCRSRLTNLPKDLNDQIRTRQIQDTTERNEEELQEAIDRLGQRINFIFPPCLLSAFQGPDDGHQMAWPSRFPSYPASISLSYIFEDFIVRQNTTMSFQSE